MRFLHTGDWHLGRTIRGRSRAGEFHDVLAEVHDIAVQERVDAMLVCGDIFDSASPGAGAERLLFEALREFVGSGIEVLLLGGNHDSVTRLEALGRLSELVGVRVRAEVVRHDEGGIVTFEKGGERAQVAAIPWILERETLSALEILEPEHAARQTYHEKVATIYNHMVDGFEDGAVHLLAGHIFVDNALVAKVDGSERRLHIDQAYGISAASLPSAPQYLALGHVHQPQVLTDAPAPTAYCGSLLQLDFGERGQQKVVRIVDATPNRPVQHRAVALTKGRPLVELAGSLDEVVAQAEHHPGAFIRAVLRVDAPERGLAERLREALPDVVDVRLDYDRDVVDAEEAEFSTLGPEDLFVRYYRAQHQREPSPELLALFRELMEEATVLA